MMPIAASVSMSLILPESMKSFMTTPLLGLNWIGELADAFDLDRDTIAAGQRADPFGRAGRDDVARLERHHERDELDQVLDRKNQVVGARPLPPLPVDPPFDAARRAVEPDRDTRPDRRKGVEPLAPRVLRFFFLQVAGSDVVDADQAEDVLPRV